MQKPRLWKFKSGLRKGKLRPKAKKYLSFKLKQSWASRRAIPEEKVPLPKEAIRAWAKMTYTGKNKPLFIEAYIDGEKGQENQLRRQLLEFISSNFGEEVAELTEVGFEKIDEIQDRTLTLNYKRSLTANWRRL